MYEAAHKAASVIKGVRLRVYQCPDCGLFHLTKNRNPWKKAKASVKDP